MRFRSLLYDASKIKHMKIVWLSLNHLTVKGFETNLESSRVSEFQSDCLQDE